MPLSTPSQRVAANVRAEIARLNRSGTSVAKNLGRSQAWMSRRLAGQVPFDISELVEVANELDVTLADLIDGAEAVA